MSNNTTASCGEGAPFDDVGMRGLKVVTILSALLSVAGSTFIMLTWRLQRGTRRSLGMHIIFCLSLADFASSLVFIIDGIAPTGVLEAEKCGGEGANSLPGLCMLLAALSQFTGLAAILWTACIAVGLHLGVLRRSKLMTQEPARLRRYMHAAVWGAAGVSLLIMSAVPNTLGPTGQWCWIRRDAMVWAGGTFYYLPLVAVFAYSMGIYGLTRRTLLHLHREASNATSLGGSGGGGGHADNSARGTATSASRGGALTGLTSRLRGFLLVFGVIHACQLTNRLWDLVFPAHPSYFLYLLQSALGPLQGLGNAIAYGWSPLTRRVWAHACPALCGWAEPVEVDLHMSAGSRAREIAPPLEEESAGGAPPVVTVEDRRPRV